MKNPIPSPILFVMVCAVMASSPAVARLPQGPCTKTLAHRPSAHASKTCEQRSSAIPANRGPLHAERQSRRLPSLCGMFSRFVLDGRFTTRVMSDMLMKLVMRLLA